MQIELKTNKTVDLRQELLDIKQKSNNNYAFKALIALAGITAGVAFILFFSTTFFPYGIGLIVLSSYILYHLVQQCRHTNKVFNQAITAMPLNSVSNRL